MYTEESFKRKHHFKKFTKKERSSFSYWFNHWKAFNLLAHELHVWKPKYLFHDIEKPWLRLFLPYEKVQAWHRKHNNHHIEWMSDDKHNLSDFDIIGMVIDNECSRYTKLNAKETALEYAIHCKHDMEQQYQHYYLMPTYQIFEKAEIKARELGLTK